MKSRKDKPIQGNWICCRCCCCCYFWVLLLTYSVVVCTIRVWFFFKKKINLREVEVEEEEGVPMRGYKQTN